MGSSAAAMRQLFSLLADFRHAGDFDAPLNDELTTHTALGVLENFEALERTVREKLSENVSTVNLASPNTKVPQSLLFVDVIGNGQAYRSRAVRDG